MQFRDADPMDFPPPPTADSITAEFGVALFTFAPQPALDEWGAGRQSHSSNGGPAVLDHASLGATLWRNPEDHDDPVNLADLPESTRRSLDEPPPRPLPDWMQEVRRRMRYPFLGEAVWTSPVRLDDAGPHVATVESVLIEHARYILINTFREERTDGSMRAVLRDAPTPGVLEPAEVEIDGALVDGLRLGSDAHVVAVGAQVGDRILTAVVPRAELAHVRLAFVTRPTPA
jgi:hypothetical protein